MQKNIAFYLFIAPWLLGLIFLVLIPVLGGVGISLPNYDGLNAGNLKFLGFRNYMRNPTLGLVNQTLDLVFPGVQINWLTEYAMIALTTIAVWTGLGAGIVIFLAGLQGIPVALEEAALIDGANRFQSLRHVTIPLMTPIIFYQLVLSIVTAMQYFALPMLLAPTAGGGGGALGAAPTRAVYLFMVHSFRQAFGFHRYGYATALTWFLVILILLFTAVLFWSAPKWVHSDTET